MLHKLFIKNFRGGLANVTQVQKRGIWRLLEKFGILCIQLNVLLSDMFVIPATAGIQAFTRGSAEIKHLAVRRQPQRNTNLTNRACPGRAVEAGTNQVHPQEIAC